jgi:16S rRNA (cytosine1402-N4)-methyltransferase
MAVNDEPAELDALLKRAPAHLKQGGRWVVIAFHSGEDRKVKNAFRDMGHAGIAKVLTKHVVRPGPEETRRNPPSRSAVLRALEMGTGGSGKLHEQDSKDESA